MAAAKTTARKGATTRRRKERKNIERGAAHIQSTFNNTIVTITDTRLPEIHAFCRPDRGGDRRPRGDGARAENRGSVRQGPRRRP